MWFTDGSEKSYFALNEMAVTRGNFGRILSLDVSINGHFLASISGDGLIVSTSTGSTAYALSAGGPFIAPDFEGLCVVPISPHTLNARSIVTSATDVVTLTPTATNRQHVILFFDGEIAKATECAEPTAVRIEVRSCPEKLRLLRFGESSFYDQIASTFFRRSDA